MCAQASNVLWRRPRCAHPHLKRRADPSGQSSLLTDSVRWNLCSCSYVRLQLIATRWSSSLKGPRLEIVMCANDGYSPGMTNFACRVARSRKALHGPEGEGGTDIIAVLKEYAARVDGLTEAMGSDFARGHKEVRFPYCVVRVPASLGG